MDSTFLGIGGPQGEMWHTYSSMNSSQFFVEYVFITNLTEPYRFTWNELLTTQDDDNTNRVLSNTYIGFDLNQPTAYVWLTSDNSSSIQFPECRQNSITFNSPFHLYTFVPFINQSHWILFGELSKQLPITKQRFISIDSSSEIFSLQIFGIENEQFIVTIGYVQNSFGKIDLLQIDCSFNSTSVKTITCQTADTCHCA